MANEINVQNLIIGFGKAGKTQSAARKPHS